MSNIILSANNNADVMVLPVVPPDIPVKSPQNNEVFSTIKGDVLIIGKPGLREVSITSFFPVNKDYPFIAHGAERNGFKYVEFIENYRRLQKPVRLVWTTKDKYTVLNMLCAVESFEYAPDKVGDLNYTLALKEFIDDPRQL